MTTDRMGADPFASLIETCGTNGVEPYVWLGSTLEIAAGHPQSRIHELLPWNFDLVFCLISQLKYLSVRCPMAP